MSSVVKTVGNIVGGITGSSAADAASKAADIQSQSAQQAAAQQMEMFKALQQGLAPYVALGTGSQNALLQAMGYNPTIGANGQLTGMSVNPNSPLQQKFSFNPTNLAQTPGYQFALQQGLKSQQNSMSARGLGLSGAQQKAAAEYATGLADQTYNNQYNNALSTYNTNYQTSANNVNNLLQLLQAGQNAAAQTGVQGLNAANTAGGYLTSGANALAAGKIGNAAAYQNSPLMGLAKTGATLYAGNALGLFG